MLTPRFIVGFTGHRHLDKPEPIAAAIRTALEQLREQARAAGGEIELFTSIAYGADTLAVEAARGLGIPVHLVLPKPIETDNDTGAVQLDQNFPSDFWDKPDGGQKTFRQEDWDRAWKQIQDAQHGIDGGTLRLVRGVQTDPECYYDTGIQIAQASDVIIAVWDGKDSDENKLGGTADIVAHVRTELNRPLLVIDAVSGALHPEHLEHFASISEVQCREISKVNELLGEPKSQGIIETEAIFTRLTSTAETEAGNFRSGLIRTIFLHGLATIIAGFAAIMPDQGIKPVAVLMVLALIEFILVFVAWRMSRAHAQRHTHERWLRARFGAELVRGLRAGSPFLDPLEPQVARHKPRWARFALMIGLMARREQDRSKTWQKRRTDYVNERLADQLGYFAKEQQKASTHMRQTQLVATLATGISPMVVFGALGYKVWHLVEIGLHGDDVASASFSWVLLGTKVLVLFLPIFFPLIASIASGLRAALDATRRTHRYDEMTARLQATRAVISNLKTESATRRTVVATEEVLLDELIEWDLAEKQNGGH
ncbi:MAG: hypothetical protein B7Z37_30635 [Verrucomicrobia bacterium 12-59-8]|nr:MAG: hypothetical protein B7Z37_30635 [Verrucomicrobia bacterium 12-59-8]